MATTASQRPGTASRAGSRAPRRAGLARLRALGVGSTEITVAVALVALMTLTSTAQPRALSVVNIKDVLQAAVPLVLLALGELLVVATAGIDLSVGSVFSLTGMVTARMLAGGHGVPASVTAGLATGLVFGALNGILVALVRLAPFVVTLVSYAVAGSLAFVVTGGNSVPVSNAAFGSIYAGSPLGIPNYFLFPLLLIVLLQLGMAFSVPGRWLFATGSNQRAARLVGIPVRSVTCAAYVISGLLAAFASILSVSYLANAEVTAGSGLELQAIAAVVIGGASLFGGTGTAIGALLGALMITAIQNVVNLLGINTFWQGAVTGAVILTAVLIDRLTSASRGRWRRPLLPHLRRNR